MPTATCINECCYEGALTYGRQYLVIALDDEDHPRKVRIQGDNGRVRWYPASCFDLTGRAIPRLETMRMCDDLAASDTTLIEVEVTLSDGTRRWCWCGTPAGLAHVGERFIDGTRTRVLYGVPHLIVISTLNEQVISTLNEQIIDQVLHYIEPPGRAAAMYAGYRRTVSDQNMELSEVKERLGQIEPLLPTRVWVELATFERDGRLLHVGLTDRLRKRARKEGIWKSGGFCTTLKNAAYGFEERRARSPGGQDGIFLMDKTFRPRNEMMRKLFDRFLEKPESGVREIAEALNVKVNALLPVRLVSHHMRLLGVLCRKVDADWLVLVDCDRTKYSN